jgi:hypothetical protein
MSSVTKVLSWIFAAISLGVVAFFTHKVLWLVRYKKLQRKLMDEAAAQLRAAQQTALPEWEKFAAAAWRVARGPQHGGQLDSPIAYTQAVEHELGITISRLNHRIKLAPLLRHAVERTEAGPIEEVVLETPMRDGSVCRAQIRLDPPLVQSPAPPPESAYELNVKSRYSFWRRALVFVTGLADVVYSSHHIAKMSQYAHVSTGTILRRMSLVILLVVGIILEVVVGLRAALEKFLERHLLRGASWTRGLPDVLGDNLAALLALVIWTGIVAGLYFGLYFRIRRRSKQNLAALQQLRDRQNERLLQIRNEHLVTLTAWADAYGKSLDSAVELTARHVEMLGNHYAARVRRRLGGPLLLEMAKLVSDALFAKLPEASTTLQDAVTTTERSFAHAVWPRRDEMGDVIEQAQYREAWQQLELTLGELQRGEPDPQLVASLWRTLVSFAVRFADALPGDIMERLRATYVKLVEDTSAGTERDLARYQEAVRDLMHHLHEQLASATPLLSARIELANQRIRADSANFTAEVIRAREAARLEAMAFEI